MSEPETQTNPIAVLVVCSCCGAEVEISDVVALIRSLHLQNACPSMDGVLR